MTAFVRLEGLDLDKLAKKEQVAFELLVNKSQAEKHRKDIENFANDWKMGSRDKLNLTWTLDILYFGDVAEKLESIGRLAKDPDLLLKVDIQEVLYGRSVILETLKQLDEAVARIKAREGRNE